MLMEKVMKRYDWRKIQLTKQGTLNVQYVNEQSDMVTIDGANIVHTDLREALKGLVPHLAMLTEQREVARLTLDEIRSQREVLPDDDMPKTIWQKLKVDSVVLGDNCITIGGSRILDSGFVVKVQSPKIDTGNADFYEYLDDLDLDVQAVKYEAEQYITNRKWGVMQTSLDFKDTGDPFEGEVKPDDVPEAISVEVSTVTTKKKGRKKKQVTA